ncbi:FAD-dependent oxidoreductase [Hirschia litorea]|uniref:FAD-dependent oxidoreductase n=1 Tax=Hirschia litorea TaxID=1199156 RepID=A0ABW2IH54_9PROT
MKVLVVGGGIAGLTTALCCIQQGLSVQVFEQASELTEVGAGLQLSPNGSRILYKLGLKEQLEKVAFKPRSLDMRLGRSGKKIFSISMKNAEAKYHAPYLHIHRADLINVLKQAITTISSDVIHLNHTVVNANSNADGAELTFLNGNKAHGDVIIGADGIHSKIKEIFSPSLPPKFTGNVAWRALIPTIKLPTNLIPPSATVWTGNKRHAVTYYVSQGRFVNFVGVVEEENWTKESWNETGDCEELRSIFSNFHPTIQTLIGSIEACFKTALFDREPLSSWSNDRSVIIGDAAHPMLPFMAQGAVMAIEDASVLAALLSNQSSTLEKPFSQFESIRKPRTSRVQAAASSNMALFHHGTHFSQLLNYGPMWLAARLAPSFVNSRQDWLYLHDAENPN